MATKRNGHRPKWSAAVSACGGFGLWPFRFAAVSVCVRFGCGLFGLWPLWPVTRWIIERKVVTEVFMTSLKWRHNERDDVPYHQLLYCLLNSWFRHRSKKTSKLRVIGLCAGNSPVTNEFPTQKASNAENVSIWWRHHVRSQNQMCNPLWASWMQR